jgi:hypothetical protein
MNYKAIFIISIAAMLTMVGTAAAVTTVITGQILDETNSNAPVNGALVKIYESDCATQLGTNSDVSHTTGSDVGTYSVVIPEQPALTEICVKATLGDLWGTKLTTVSGTPTWDVLVLIESVGINIPEFPTIALPVAAMIGLMFIINSRKKEE